VRTKSIIGGSNIKRGILHRKIAGRTQPSICPSPYAKLAIYASPLFATVLKTAKSSNLSGRDPADPQLDNANKGRLQAHKIHRKQSYEKEKHSSENSND
jgi:hypothetical protein